MRRFRLLQVDVFTRVPLAGNPVAVILDAGRLRADEMQAIARETNLSETTFVLPPTTAGTDYRVRIFTPRHEVPFAGHPTIGTVAALIASEQLPRPATATRVHQECGVGIVNVTVTPEAGGLSFSIAMPSPAWRAARVSREHCARTLGCTPAALAPLPLEVASTGLPWLVVALDGLATIRMLRPDFALLAEVAEREEATGVTVFCVAADDPGCRLHLRSFAPGAGVPEDPVCGSGNGAVAAYVARHGLLGAGELVYVAEQGAEVARPGRVSVRGRRDERGDWHLEVGGAAVVVVDGWLTLAEPR
ncbi:MAG: PhzF family phenazine biosynthesis protein [Deltaproteobacteria bacterium]|nr:MAG: PhzF family phenazine biosynthesis protein [Deltaproteobacteria bacterium]